ncbi:MAG: CDP-alcohol phosphatidyltransferase family protein [Verrucomicrobiota bacterium]|nr:CDP-alcohol phosphatidyltransferase family protein [Verrucomicrobiota bacterium]
MPWRPFHEDGVLASWRQVIPTAFTLAAMFVGFLSILTTIQGMVAGGNPCRFYQWSAKLIMLAMVFDGLDGNVARWLGGQSEFGGELDTYVDLTAFGIAPAILVFAVTLPHKDPFWRILLPSCVALSGVVRLARFKVKDPLRGQGGYAGLPITANASWVALFCFVTLIPPRDELTGKLGVLFLVGIAIFIVLQVSRFHYPKPTKKAALFVPCLILVALFLFAPRPWNARVAIVMIAGGLVYVFLGPLFFKGMEAHRARKEAVEP